LHQRLRAEAGARGVLVVAHELTGLEAYDEIVVLAGGRVVERGTHPELLRRGGWYRRTAEAQAAYR